jgi:predicted MPP superfamily phosphohydrolase
VGLAGTGVRTALGDPRLTELAIELPRLHRGGGWRIALVSDIHLGPLNGVGRTRRIVDMINGLEADFVAIVGDLVDGSVAELGPAAAPLGNLRSRYGSFFVTGNHEYFSGYEEWIDEVQRLGIRPLRQRAGLDCRTGWTWPASTTSPARATATRRTWPTRWRAGIPPTR